MTSSSRFPCLRPGYCLCLLVLAIALGGCGGGSTYSFEPGTIAKRFLPTTREVSHHPDSLRALSIQEKEGRYQIELAESYSSLHQKWSCTYRDLGPGRSRDGRSYATFWSLELSLASLEPEMGVSSLSGEQAQKALTERREEYQNTLQFDVYWFEAEGNSLLVGPGSSVRLRVNETETYRPSEEKNGPLRDTFLATETRSALYRRNTFYFSRVVDSTDILDEAERLELIIDRPGSSAQIRFTWSWEEAKASRWESDRANPPTVAWQRRAHSSVREELIR